MSNGVAFDDSMCHGPETSLQNNPTHPHPTGGGGTLPNSDFWALGCPLAGLLPRREPYMGAFLPVQSVPMPIHGGLFASAKCPHAHIWAPFCQCKVSPCPYMGAVLPVQSVPMPIWHITTFTLFFSRARASLWQAHRVSPPSPWPSPLGLWCVYCVSILSRGMDATLGGGLCTVMGGDVLGRGWCGSMGGDWRCSRSGGLGHLHLLAHLIRWTRT